MFRTVSVLFLSIGLVMLCVLPSGSTEPISLANASFEIDEPLVGATLYPTDFSNWQGDPASIVTAADGITPYDGQRMLQFLATEPVGPSSFTGSDMQQNVDLSAIRDPIKRGVVRIRASAFYNRVAGDHRTDTAFELGIYAYNLAEVTPVWSNHSARSITTILTDDLPETWELATAELLLPFRTTFVGIRVSARENIFNESAESEFAGHFADRVNILVIVPEPGARWVFVNGMVGLMLMGNRQILARS
jgi:hypothetical protein